MSQALQRLPEQNALARSPEPGTINLRTTSQYLTFEPGLFQIELTTPHSFQSEVGLRLPSIRLEPVPPTPSRPGRVSLVTTSEGGWISRADDPTFVLVVGGRAGAVLTVYRIDDNSPAPNIRVRSVPIGQVRRVDGPVAASGQELAGPANADIDGPAVPIALVAHVSTVGDVSAAGGRWVGRPGSGMPVEGFAITPDAGIAKEDIEYQAILGNNWNTPWFHGGEFCGSRGLMLPLLGFRVRLLGAATEAFTCTYSGVFVGGQTVGPVAEGEACDAGDAPLEALMISITPRVGAQTEPADATVEPPDDEPAPSPRPRRGKPVRLGTPRSKG